MKRLKGVSEGGWRWESAGILFLRKNGLIVTQAYTTIESKKYATIGGIVTSPEWVSQSGSGIACGFSCICEDILKDNKIPNLFYSNEDAGRVYEKSGICSRRRLCHV
jgi:predicted GNAT family acetyltransferase